MQINNNKTKETDPEAQATTNEPKAEAKTKEPPTLKESIDTNVIFTAVVGSAASFVSALFHC